MHKINDTSQQWLTIWMWCQPPPPTCVWKLWIYSPTFTILKFKFCESVIWCPHKPSNMPCFQVQNLILIPLIYYYNQDILNQHKKSLSTEDSHSLEKEHLSAYCYYRYCISHTSCRKDCLCQHLCEIKVLHNWKRGEGAHGLVMDFRGKITHFSGQQVTFWK
jgi:hypothetical protein